MTKRSMTLASASLATLLALFAPTPLARADIFQWAYINSDVGIGQSMTLCLEGAGVNVGPGANLANLNLTRAYLAAANLSDANFTQANLTQSTFKGGGGTYSSTPAANLTGANFSQSNLTNADFGGYVGFDPNDPGAYYYLGADLTGASLAQANLTGANFMAATLTNADLSHTKLNASFGSATLTGANLIGADVRGADFRRAPVDYFPFYDHLFGGITLAQLYSTASYLAHDLTGIFLHGNDLTGANLANQNLTNAGLSANLTGANLSGADARGANFQYATLTGTNTSNLIQSDGHVAGLNLTAGASLVVRHYDAKPAESPPTGLLPIVVDQYLATDDTGTLRLVFDADPWDSTISFAPGIPVVRGGTLELTFAPEVNLATQIGRTIDLFKWTGVTPTGVFTVTSPYSWNLAKLYSTGEVTLAAVPSLPGDYNLDNFVDASDYTVWRNHLGTNFDLNGNGNETGGSTGVVDEADYSWWKQNYGRTAGLGGGGIDAGLVGAVPEPATLATLLLGVLLILAPRRALVS